MSNDAAVAAIEAHEQAKKQYRQLCWVLKPQRSAGLDRIDVPNEYSIRQEGESVPRIPLVTKGSM
jgi:hypothetical protein